MKDEKLFTQESEKYIEHEVKLRVHDAHFKAQEKNMSDIRSVIIELNTKMDSQFHLLDSKIDTNFKWTIGIMIAMFVGSIIAKLI